MWSAVAYAPGNSDEYTKNQAKGVLHTACSVEMTRFYVAEIVQALEYMHSKVRSLSLVLLHGYAGEARATLLSMLTALPCVDAMAINAAP